ncbi:MAG: HAMP domain-containing histidine kinase [Elusimicrobia bacterium]|nr:HAMP domain-containing histidine kinase [Elusimicrobiota bacterium]
MTLRTRFLIQIVGLILGSFLLYGAALFWTQRDYLISEQERANREESSRWSLLCEQSVLSKDEIILVNYLREVRRSGDVAWASFVAENGRVLMHSDLSRKNTTDTGPVAQWALSLDGPAIRTDDTIDSPRLYYAAPVQRAGAAILAFDKGRQNARRGDALKAFLKRFSGITLLCLLLGVAVAVGVARSLASPLNDLTAAVRQLGAGDWRARSSVNRTDEIGELALAFADMSRRLARLDEMKDHFVATVSHDLRNPLGAITMAARYLIAPPTPLSAESTHQILNTILVSTARLRTMVDNVLDAAKIKEGRLTAHIEPFSLEKILIELRDLFQSQADEFGRDFQVNLPMPCPLALGDEAHTYRILANLLNNAFKFTSAGDHIRVSVQTDSEGFLAVEVQDSGPGLSPEDMDGLFQPFQTVASVEAPIRKQQGTGLGLAIAHALAEAQGGNLSVRSDRNIATTFRLVLPMGRET